MALYPCDECLVSNGNWSQPWAKLKFKPQLEAAANIGEFSCPQAVWDGSQLAPWISMYFEYDLFGSVNHHEFPAIES